GTATGRGCEGRAESTGTDQTMAHGPGAVPGKAGTVHGQLWPSFAPSISPSSGPGACVLPPFLPVEGDAIQVEVGIRPPVGVRIPFSSREGCARCNLKRKARILTG